MIIKIPFYAGGLGKTKGVEKAPDKIITKLRELNCNEDGIKSPINEMEIKVNNSNIEESQKVIETEMKKIFQDYSCPIILGGDHSITYSTFKAFNQGNCGLLIFDAHPDLMQEFNPATHENYLRNLIAEGLNPSNIILLGTRNQDIEEINFIKKNNIKNFTMKKISYQGIQEVCSTIMETCNKFDKLYISIDIDSVDPVFAPGTGHPEIGGLTSRELLYVVHRLKNLKNIKAIDLVELNPDIEEKLTISLGAKIVNELFGSSPQ